MEEIKDAKKDVDEMFKSIAPMVQEIVDKYSAELDKLLNKLESAAYLTNEELREFILSLSVESYMFGMSKDASILKQECATTLMKESMAIEYNNADGTQVVRTNASLINTEYKQVVNLLYSSVANMMKTKLDETHRMINALNSILISRNAEAKLSNEKQEFEQPTRIRLLEETT